MEKMWAGRFEKALDKSADDFNSSIHFDKKMYAHDIKGSLEHAAMLASVGILTAEELTKITDGLTGILDDLNSGALNFDENAEDIHMFVEATLTARIGDAGKKLHTARSRNDQVALDLRLYMRDKAGDICDLLKKLTETVLAKAKENTDEIKNHWRLDKVYTPNMEEKEKEALLKNWHKAVERASGWEDDL